MKNFLFNTLLLLSLFGYSQNIQVDSQTYSPQQLVEDILIDSNCISNVIATNVVGGDFGGADQSYGYFDASGTSFPFQSGIVLSTGRLINTQGPNTSLSDDNAPNWDGDNDLENILNENNTTNATILEFEFTSNASAVSFRYIFASEEYQENNQNTCQFSDLFGFLIRPQNDQQYTNIALVPNTQTPVKVTTVHPDIPGGCDAENEAYFESFNGAVSPINFNGQTKVLTATAQIVPNQTYHVKLVIADEQNFRYDSAVFLEAGSFQLSTDLGPDRLLANGNPVCENENLTLNATTADATGYLWYKDGVAQTPTYCATCPEFNVTEAGEYAVEILLNNGCLVYGDVTIEYAPTPIVFNATLTNCESDQSGLSIYNLYDTESEITNNDNSIFVIDFYLTQTEAEQDINPIQTATQFENTTASQIVFARIENQARCYSIAEVTLETTNNTIIIDPVFECDNTPLDGFTTFNLNNISADIASQVPSNAIISYYASAQDALTTTNPLSSNYTNTTAYTQTIYVRVDASNQCYSTTSVTLNTLNTPELLPDETVFYCTNFSPNTITLLGGVQNDSPNNYNYQWLFNNQATAVTTSFFEANEIGEYTVIVSDPNGCSSTRTITVNPSSNPIITLVDYTSLSINNTVTVNVIGSGNYEYVLDNENGVYQSSNIFNGVNFGPHTVYVRDVNMCGSTSQNFTISVLSFPNYFTPNGDQYNATWNPFGNDLEFDRDSKVYIFNRFGKLLTVITPNSRGWDGTLNGKHLPSTDYWYYTKLEDGTERRGHFTLIR